MSKKADLLIANMLGNRWAASTVVAGATVSAGSPTEVNQIQPNTRAHLDTLWYSLRNFVGAGSAASTVTVQVRHASVAGTVIAQAGHLVGASSIANVALTDLNFVSKRGGSLWVTTDTFVSSLTATVTAAGWLEDTNG